jgi:hypothetical protein
MLEKTNGPEPDDNPQSYSAVGTKPPKPVQHRWFDQWLIARGEPLRLLIQRIVDLVDSKQYRKPAALLQ